jgi:D-beta-D-heptose 7-phosphate kinase/D-beta-D-heptose 1-phosphate adenosyltransferase
MKVSKKFTPRTKTQKGVNKKIVMVSGGFDPIHIGHIRYIQEAKKLGDYLIVVLNNDNWLRFKKGKEFMGELERKEILEAITGVDRVIISGHTKNTKDISVCEEIKKIKPHIFANGGDRTPDWVPVPEVALCEKLGIKMVYNIGRGGKVRSSTELVKKYSKHLEKYAKKN